jgi:predicted DNA-binding transcriptional regulator AlpA
MRRIVALRRFDMRLHANLANSDPTLAALVPDGVTLADILGLFQTVYHVNGEQLLRKRLGAAHPANLALPELAEFIKYMLEALKSAGVRDPADVLAHGVQLKAQEATTKLATSADIAAQPKPDLPPVKLENNPSGTSAASPPPAAQAIPYGMTKGEEERQPDQPISNATLQTISNPEVTNPETANARDEIVIEGRRLLSEPRFAEKLGCSLRTLQRGRKAGKGPPYTKIGRKVYYELNDVQEWIDRGKIR